MDRDVTHKILYGPKRSWGSYIILWVTDQSINCHLARSAMNYLLYYTQYMQICQTTCFWYCISKTKNEFGQNPEENIILIGPGQYTKILTGQYYTFIAYWWGKYENLLTQEYHIPRGQCPRGIWYSWVNKFSYFLYPHAINVLLYRMKPRKHIYRYVKYCWQTYFKSIRTLSQILKNHIVTVAFKWCVPSATNIFLSKNDNSGGKTREVSEVVEYDFYFTEYDFCPVWSRVLIFAHCPIKLIYLW